MRLQRAEVCSVWCCFFQSWIFKPNAMTCIELNRKKQTNKTNKKSTFLYISISLRNRHQNGNTFLRQDRFVIYLFTVQRYPTLYKINLISLNVYFSNELICRLNLPACVQDQALQVMGLVMNGLSPSTKNPTGIRLTRPEVAGFLRKHNAVIQTVIWSSFQVRPTFKTKCNWLCTYLSHNSSAV